MLIAAAVCPHPPLLVPAATGAAKESAGTGPAGTGPVGTGPGRAELAALRQACDAAVAMLTAADPDLLIAVGGAGHTARHPADAAGTLAGFGVPFTIGDGPPVLPLSLTQARWLLARAGVERPVLQAIAASAPAERCLLLGAELAALAPRVALLAMGDGPARRARRAPGAIDADADRYDQQLAHALASGAAAELAELDPRLDDELFIAGRASWQVLAGAALADAGARLAGELRYAAAPFEVSYFVATWRLERISRRKISLKAGYAALVAGLLCASRREAGAVKTAPPPIFPVFRSRLTVAVLERLYVGGGECSVTELAAAAQSNSGTTAREVSRLEEAAIVRSRRVGHTKLVRANESAPFFAALRDLAVIVLGPAHVLGQELAGLNGVEAAAIFGSWAARINGEPGPSPADIDLLVVGRPDRDELHDAIERGRTRLGRNVHVVVVQAKQWKSGKDPFLEELRCRPLSPIGEMPGPLEIAAAKALPHLSPFTAERAE
jgi:predicted nucleotidyltransferase